MGRSGRFVVMAISLWCSNLWGQQPASTELAATGAAGRP